MEGRTERGLGAEGGKGVMKPERMVDFFPLVVVVSRNWRRRSANASGLEIHTGSLNDGVPSFPPSQQRLAARVRACVTCDVGARGSGVATLCRCEGAGIRGPGLSLGG